MTVPCHDTTALQERLDFLGLDAGERETLRSLAPVIGTAAGPALDRFYGKVRSTPQVAGHFTDDARVSGAKQAQQRHWGLIADAAFDRDYVAGVTTIGKVHARLGLEPRWYIGGYALILQELIGALVAARPSRPFGRGRDARLALEVSVLVKSAMLDMDYAISTYLDALEEARREAENEKAKAEEEKRRALDLLDASLTEFASGNLRNRLGDDLPGGFAEMARNFNAAAASLHDAIAEVRATSASILSSAQGIANASDDLSQRTEQQAASLEESSAALHQLSESVRSTADNAARAATVVEATQSEADQSGQVVADAVDAMGKIKDSSEKIGAIIGVIDEIAFQTNLLALNAGVEAARAGDAGRGFAVVAQEVRSLAQRSAASAREIKELISTSGGHVASGVSLVGAAGEALGRMVGRVDEMSVLMTGIASAAREQAQGLGEINAAVGQMDQITQRNAAMVEETTAETERLKGEAQELMTRLERFELESGPARVARLPARVKPALVTAAQPMARRAANGPDGWEEF